MKSKLLAVLLLGSFYSLQSFALGEPICSELFERDSKPIVIQPYLIPDILSTPIGSFKEILGLVQSAPSGSMITMELTHLDADFVGSLFSRVILTAASESNIQFRILVPATDKTTDITLLNVLAHNHNIEVRTLGASSHHEITHNTFVLQMPDHSYDIIQSNRDLKDDAYLSNKNPSFLTLNMNKDNLLTTTESNVNTDDGHTEFQIFNNVFWNNTASSPVQSTFWGHNSLAGSPQSEGAIYRRAKLLARAMFRNDFNESPSQEDGPSALVKKILERLR